MHVNWRVSIFLHCLGLSSVLRPHQHSIGYMGDGFVQQLVSVKSTVNRIVCQHLKLWNICSRWVAKQLKPEQKTVHMMTCVDRLQHYDTERGDAGESYDW